MMTTLEEIESAAARLSPGDFARLRDWIAEHDNENGDQQIERDSVAGKFKVLFDDAGGTLF